jgi:hypothetical protein
MFINDLAGAGIHVQLARLLLGSHATHQVVDAGVEWRSRLPVQRCLARGLSVGRSEMSREKEASGATEHREQHGALFR